MPDSKDLEQDAMIRRNAENIERNQAAILRQTECLEQIRAHYYPKKTAWKRCVGLFLKLVGALTIITGLQEGVQWLWDSHKTKALAEHCANVAQRLLFEESDFESAMAFSQKAAELVPDDTDYRARFTYMKGLRTVSKLFGIKRPLQPAERTRVDGILAEAKYMQEVSPEDPIAYVLEAQARILRGESQLALEAVGQAVTLQPSNAFVRITSCAVFFTLQDFSRARGEIEVAAQINPKLPMVRYWQGFLTTVIDHDFEAAGRKFSEMIADMPQFYIGHQMLAWTKLNASVPDLAGARDAYETAYRLRPDSLEIKIGLAACYERGGELTEARLWLDQALEQDPLCMEALLARARVAGAAGDFACARADLDAAIRLSSFDGSLYRLRAELRSKAGDAGAAEDRKTAAALRRKMFASWCSLGTSITWYNDNVKVAGGRFTTGYQTFVTNEVAFTGFMNRGVNGGCVASQLGHVDRADWYTIEHGINDWGHSTPVGTLDDYRNPSTNKTFCASYRRLIDEIRTKNPKAKIILCTPRRAYGFNGYLPASWDQPKNGIYLEDYAKVIRQIAATEGFALADFFATSSTDPAQLRRESIDVALHPNDAGHRLMATELVRIFKRGK